VVRFDSDPAALAALTADGQPTGVLPVPVVSIHSMNDPQAAVEAQFEFRARAAAAGNGGRLVQAYTDENGQHGAKCG
jgi:predicted alpha/beta hydrolase family esterase